MDSPIFNCGNTQLYGMAASTACEAGAVGPQGPLARLKDSATQTTDSLAEEYQWQRETADAMLDDAFDDEMSVMRTVQMIGGAVVGIAVIVIVVNELLTTDAVANTTGPFDGVIESLGTTGVAAMSLLVIGLLVASASRILDFFGGGF
jgi:hypothetical protein